MPTSDERFDDMLTQLLSHAVGRKARGGVPHDHAALDPGCFRCDLNGDEMGLDADE